MRKLRHTKGDHGHKKIGGDCLKLQVRNELSFQIFGAFLNNQAVSANTLTHCLLGTGVLSIFLYRVEIFEEQMVDDSIHVHQNGPACGFMFQQANKQLT